MSTGDARALGALTDDQRRHLVARALSDPESQQELARQVRAAVDELRRDNPPAARGAFDRALAEVAAALREDSPGTGVGSRYLRGEVGREVLLADPAVRAALTARMARGGGPPQE